jgi:hypothetical protein
VSVVTHAKLGKVSEAVKDFARDNFKRRLMELAGVYGMTHRREADHFY